MFDDAFADLEGEVESPKSSVALLEIFHNAQRVQVVIEGKTVLAHRGVERLFPGVAERRMADVVNERQDFGEIYVQRECSGNGSGDLRDFQCMGQAVAEVIGVAAGEDLGFGFQTPESAS